MYRNTNDGQSTIYDFILPFGGHLNKNNRWVKLRGMINWKMIDEEYSKNFRNKDGGNEAYPAEVAFGSLYIQRRLGFTDRELVEQIAENPYMQYFIGYKEYSSDPPFDPSVLTTFRKRLPEAVMSRIIEKMFIDHDEGKEDKGGNPGGSSGASGPQEPKERPNRGTLIIDATCTPADISYPTDLELCDRARRWTEVILDHYWSLYGSADGSKVKPRTYREVARRRFLMLNKRRRKTAKKVRKELRYQLGCINRNLGYIEDYVLAHAMEDLSRVERDRLLTVYRFHGQQKEMLDNRTHSIEGRIVSLSQPWVRPIVRGKSKAPTEFGAKLSISVVNGYTFIDKLSFDAYNEGEASEFERVVEEYRRRFGRYPERILADKIYRSRPNRSFCKKHGIRISGPGLGRPGKEHAADIRQELRETGERNEVEGRFGTGKRKLGLARIMAKLKETTGSMIAMDVFILNMERLFRRKMLFLCAFFDNAEFRAYEPLFLIENTFEKTKFLQANPLFSIPQLYAIT